MPLRILYYNITFHYSTKKIKVSKELSSSKFVSNVSKIIQREIAKQFQWEIVVYGDSAVLSQFHIVLQCFQCCNSY